MRPRLHIRRIADDMIELVRLIKLANVRGDKVRAALHIIERDILPRQINMIALNINPNQYRAINPPQDT